MWFWLGQVNPDNQLEPVNNLIRSSAHKKSIMSQREQQHIVFLIDNMRIQYKKRNEHKWIEEETRCLNRYRHERDVNSAVLDCYVLWLSYHD